MRSLLRCSSLFAASQNFPPVIHPIACMIADTTFSDAECQRSGSYIKYAQPGGLNIFDRAFCSTSCARSSAPPHQVHKMVAISQLPPDIRLQARAASDRTVRPCVHVFIPRVIIQYCYRSLSNTSGRYSTTVVALVDNL